MAIKKTLAFYKTRLFSVNYESLMLYSTDPRVPTQPSGKLAAFLLTNIRLGWKTIITLKHASLLPQSINHAAKKGYTTFGRLGLIL